MDHSELSSFVKCVFIQVDVVIQKKMNFELSTTPTTDSVGGLHSLTSYRNRLHLSPEGGSWVGTYTKAYVIYDE